MVYVRQATPGMAFDVDQVLNAEHVQLLRQLGIMRSSDTSHENPHW